MAVFNIEWNGNIQLIKSDFMIIFDFMIEMTVTEFSRNLSAMFDRIEYKHEEIVLIRHNHRIARIIPGSFSLNALEAMADLYRTLPQDAGRDWLKESRVPGTIADEVSDPWDI